MYYNIEFLSKFTPIPLNINPDTHILTYDVDVLSRTVFYTTEQGFYLYNWGSGAASGENTIRLKNNLFDPGKMRFDNIGKMLYISQPGGIYMSTYPYRDFHRIITEAKIVNYEILGDIGYLIL